MSRCAGLCVGLQGAGFRSRACWTVVILLCWVRAVTTQAGLWNSAYYAGWTQNDMPAQAVDFSAMTHIIHFSVFPNTNGTLDSTTFNLTYGNSTDLVTRAHAAGRRVLLCVGGADSSNGFVGATSAGTLSTFITNLVSFMTTRGYDGIDVDWEPLPSIDFAQFTNLVDGLRTALNGFSPPKLLTAAVGAYPPYGDSPTAQYTMFAALQSKFDQINIMTYDLSGPYEGWITWFKRTNLRRRHTLPQHRRARAFDRRRSLELSRGRCCAGETRHRHCVLRLCLERWCWHFDRRRRLASADLD